MAKKRTAYFYAFRTLCVERRFFYMQHAFCNRHPFTRIIVDDEVYEGINTEATFYENCFLATTSFNNFPKAAFS